MLWDGFVSRLIMFLCAMCEVFVSKEKKVNAEAVRICSLPRG